MLSGVMSGEINNKGALALCVLTALVVLPVLLTPQHGNYDTGFWRVPAWEIEEALGPEGRFISYRQGIFGGNFLGIYWLALFVLPVVSGYRAVRGRGGGLALIIGAAAGTAGLVGYHLLALIVAMPGWGVLVVLGWFALTFAVGLGWYFGDRRA